tara:strand:+ start:396 stop:1058 length:663 start_codon:yes stop_codon:yes gene_type:complete
MGKISGNIISGATAAAGASLANDADNRLVTAVGDGSINGEANATFDGTTLQLLASAGGLKIATDLQTADVNTLSAYEQGTFTPIPRSHNTSIQRTDLDSVGWYIRIGNFALATAIHYADRGTNSSFTKFSGCPFGDGGTSGSNNPSVDLTQIDYSNCSGYIDFASDQGIKLFQQGGIVYTYSGVANSINSGGSNWNVSQSMKASTNVTVSLLYKYIWDDV